MKQSSYHVDLVFPLGEGATDVAKRHLDYYRNCGYDSSLSFLSSYQNVKAAVANAVYFHGASADYYREHKAATSMLASDVSENLAYVMKEFE